MCYPIVNQEPDLLFVYGSLLLPAINEYARYLQSHSTDLGPGSFPGRLYNVGQYPGAQWDQLATDCVYGHIFRLHLPTAALNLLDDYEGFGPNYAQPPEFIRQLVPVRSRSQVYSCWVYLYNHSTAHLKVIQDGNYLNYLEGR